MQVQLIIRGGDFDLTKLRIMLLCWKPQNPGLIRISKCLSKRGRAQPGEQNLLFDRK